MNPSASAQVALTQLEGRLGGLASRCRRFPAPWLRRGCQQRVTSRTSASSARLHICFASRSGDQPRCYPATFEPRGHGRVSRCSLRFPPEAIGGSKGSSFSAACPSGSGHAVRSLAGNRRVPRGLRGVRGSQSCPQSTEQKGSLT